MDFKNAKKLGIIGGGQLGKMLIQAALDLDIEIWVLENDINCPCNDIAHKFIKGDITDFEAVYNFGKQVDVITIEIENINIEALKKLELEGKKVFPQPSIIENIKDKRTQKQFFKDQGIPTSDFILVDGLADIRKNSAFFPAVNKIGIGGYDGRGVQVVREIEGIDNCFDEKGILEKLVDFDKELAVVVARNPSGETKAFPVVEMVFHPKANLVEYLFSPAQISEELSQMATQIAIDTANTYKIVGLLAVEMFLTKDNQILVNEVAPRPHNSAHHTQKANFTSQYDQHIRAIFDLPLGNPEAIMQAAMVNILGEVGHEGFAVYKGLDTILKQENVYPFFYGKKFTKPFRKMGHVSILEQDFEKLKEKVKFVQKNLKVVSN